MLSIQLSHSVLVKEKDLRREYDSQKGVKYKLFW